jgi:hypothetical protein
MLSASAPFCDLPVSTCCSRRPAKEGARPLVRLVVRDELCNRRNVVPWLGNGRSGRSSLTVQGLTEPELVGAGDGLERAACGLPIVWAETARKSEDERRLRA